MQSQAALCVLGSVNIDHVWQSAEIPVVGATLAGQYRSSLGGKGFNQAIAARRAGAHVQFLCAVGQDSAGHAAQALARADGVQWHGINSTQATGSAGIFVDEKGRNCIVIGAGANGAVDLAAVQHWQPLIAQSAALLVQLETPLDSVQQALQFARQAGVITVLNPAPANAGGSAALLALADILTPNETEFAALLQRQTGQQVNADALIDCDDTQLHALCRQLHAGGTVVITLGAAGCFVSHPVNARWADARTFYRVHAVPVDCVDSTGAGDAFNGALCAHLLLHPQLEFAAHVQFANRYAGAACLHQGASEAMPYLRDLPQ